MNHCPITFEECGNSRYSPKGLRLLSRNLTNLADFPYTAQEQNLEAVARVGKMSIQGVQPKLSAIFSPKNENFQIVDTGGKYILKPQHPTYPELPENEALTMKLASAAGISAPLSGLMYSKDGSLTYFIRRFDRVGRNGKVALEDFAQLSGRDRETKYNSSMEKVAAVIAEYCTFPLVENARLFRLVLFNFLTGNEDGHLKNFSLIRNGPKVELSPAYDLLNSTIVIKAREEIALPLNGKKRGLTRRDLVDYFAKGRLGLTGKVIENTLDDIFRAQADWERLINTSFLSDPFKEKYLKLLAARRTVFGWPADF